MAYKGMTDLALKTGSGIHLTTSGPLYFSSFFLFKSVMYRGVRALEKSPQAC